MSLRGAAPVLVLALVALAGALPGLSCAAPAPVPGEHWSRYADPAAAGFDAAGLEAARAFSEEIGSGAVMVVDGRGVAVAAWGEVDRRFRCASMRKSFLSALIGVAVDAGELDLGATLADLGVDDLQPLSTVETRATVEQLIQARSGIYHPAAYEPPDMKHRRPERGSAAPGERFFYNNWDFNAAGYVYQRATGRSIYDAFDRLLARPLGMEDWRLEDGFDHYERRLSRMPAYTFRLSTRDGARFGLLYLHRGRWGGRRIVPSEWIDRSWQSYSQAFERAGYGYLWWIYQPGSLAEHPELTMYVARGLGGQMIAVIPGADLVVAHSADTDFGPGADADRLPELIDLILDARTATPSAGAATEPLAPIPYAEPLPPLVIPELVTVSTEVLDRYVGRYRIGERGGVTVERRDGFLVAEMTGRGEADFFPAGETEFFSPAVGAEVHFEVDEAGRPLRASFELKGQAMEAVPVAEPGAAGTEH